jgi:ribosome biogenesis GTPase / thiamine phosphate phosphatase
MILEALGYNAALEQYRVEAGLEHFEVGRVTAEHKERYVVRTAEGEVNAEVIGKLRTAARDRLDFPAVGDWVALMVHEPGHATIHQVFPRTSLITRKAIGTYGGTQVIAANIDHAFLVQAVDRDFNINRLERYMTICHAAGVRPFIVLTKTDRMDAHHVQEIVERIRARISDVPIIAVSNVTQDGFDALRRCIENGKTYCLLGSSGVGKSSLLNNLLGAQAMRTGSISERTSKGRHITSHRELVVLDGGGIIIDNPGMREVGITDAEGGLEATFGRITELVRECKFTDCTHSTETGCAVLAAVHRGGLDAAALANYHKMKSEAAHFGSTVVERRKKDKDFGKMVKRYKKDRGRM